VQALEAREEQRRRIPSLHSAQALARERVPEAVRLHGLPTRVRRRSAMRISWRRCR
jgi:hypothetical protein